MGYDIGRKVQAMLAKAASTPSSAEADSIIQKVNYMLERHGLSLVDLDTHMHDDPVGYDDESFQWWQADGWHGRLVAAAAKLYHVEIVYVGSARSRNLTTVTVFGRESCRQVFMAMMPYISKAVKTRGNACYKKGLYRTASVARSEIGRALTLRIWDIVAERKTAPRSPQAEQGMNMLVPVDRIQLFVKKRFPNLGGVRKGGVWKGAGTTAREQAAAINLSTQVGGSRGPALAIAKN